jgi:hypothetical protein
VEVVQAWDQRLAAAIDPHRVRRRVDMLTDRDDPLAIHQHVGHLGGGAGAVEHPRTFNQDHLLRPYRVGGQRHRGGREHPGDATHEPAHRRRLWRRRALRATPRSRRLRGGYGKAKALHCACLSAGGPELV